MWIALSITGVFCFLIGLAIWLARKEGKQSEKLEQQKKQEKELERAQKITDSVNALNADDARRRLHEIANKQR